MEQIAAEIFHAALKAVDPYDSVRLYADRIRSIYQKGDFKRLLLIGFGKAACPMAKAMEDDLADLITSGIVITKYGHGMSQESGARSQK